MPVPFGAALAYLGAMTTALYDLMVPVYLRAFAAMSAFLEKGRAYADEQGIAHEELLNTRLYEDMATLAGQVQSASDSAKLAIARLAGVEAPAMPDTEASFDELQARIAATVAFLNSVPRDKIDGREEADIEVKTP